MGRNGDAESREGHAGVVDYACDGEEWIWPILGRGWPTIRAKRREKKAWLARRLTADRDDCADLIDAVVHSLNCVLFVTTLAATTTRSKLPVILALEV